MKLDLKSSQGLLFLFQFLIVALYNVNLLSTFASLNSRTTNQMGWLGQLILDETDFRPDFLDLSNISLFDEAVGCPGPRKNFSSSFFPFLDTT